VKYRKINYEKSKYINLPDKIKNLIDKEDYARCYKNDNYYIVQLRLVNKTNYSNLEFEFDVKKNRFLTREEREQKVPKDRELFFAEYGVEIFIQYYLEEKTDILKESYQIYSLDTNEKLEDYEQDFFSMNRTFKDKAKEVYESAKKKESYNEWTNSKKALYWAGKIHQWERNFGGTQSFGGTDMPPVDFLDSSVLSGIRKKELDIDKLMPLILTKLAIWWEYDIDEFFEKVNHNLDTEYQKNN